jgi:hypothetical protein
MAKECESWPTLEEWLEAGRDLKDLPVPPDGKRLRELTTAEARQRVIAYLRSTHEEAVRPLFTKLDAEERLSEDEYRMAR